MGEIQKRPFQLSFNASLRVDFQGSRVTSEASDRNRERPRSGRPLGRFLRDNMPLREYFAQWLLGRLGTHCPRLVNLCEDITKRPGDAPVRIMRLHLPQIADIADVISCSVLVHVFKDHLLAGDPFGHRERLKNGTTIGAASSEVIHLPGSWIRDKGSDEAGDIIRMDVIANLLSFVSIDIVFRARYVALYEIAKEAVQLDA